VSAPSTIAVVLAAGGSTRMGRPKALLPVPGGTLLAAHISALRAQGLPVRVATGGHRAAVEAAARAAGALPCPNLHWQDTGPLESLHGCMHGLHDGQRLLVTPVDVPPAPPAALASLLAAPGNVVARVDGEDAHPVCVMVRDVRALGPGRTLRDALRGAQRQPVDFPDGLRNLNTPEAFRRWRDAADARG
jgi:molybdenum cofactor cytidylyltransferase